MADLDWERNALGSPRHRSYNALTDTGRTEKRTYSLRPQTVARIEALVRARRVGHSDLVDYLLDQAIDLVLAGELDIPTGTPGLLRVLR